MSNSTHRKTTRTSHFLVGDKQKKRNLKEIENESHRFIAPFQEYLDKFDLMVKKCELTNRTENNKVEIEISQHQPKKEEKDVIDNLVACQTKDSCYISDRNWCKLNQAFNLKTSLYQIKKIRKELEIFEIIEVENGFFINPEQKITFVLSKLIVDLKLKPEEDIVLKLAGDSTNLTKPALKVLNFTFTCINQGSIAKTSSGNYILGKFLINSESYDEFNTSLSEILSRLSKIKNIYVNEREYKIKFKAGGDMNFLLISYGLNAANSKYSCFYCTSTKSEFGNLDKNISINRTIKEAKELNKDTKKTKNINENKGYAHTPLIDFIEFTEVVYDTLHMYLRIPEKLMKLFIDDLNVLDRNGSNDISKRPNLKAFIDYLTDVCNIMNPFRFGNSIEPRTFRGDDLDKLFKNFNYHFDAKSNRIVFIENQTRDLDKLKRNSCSLNSNILLLNEQKLRKNCETYNLNLETNLYDHFVISSNQEQSNFNSNADVYLSREEKFVKIISLWDNFYFIHNSLKSIKIYSATNLALFDKLLKDWLELFKQIYFEEEITPYMHLVCCHSSELIKRHREINNYNLQGLEKYNDITTISYHRSTNRHLTNKEFLKTLMNKRIRTEFKLLGFESKFQIKYLSLIVKEVVSKNQEKESSMNSNNNIYLIKDNSSCELDRESWLTDLHIDHILYKLQHMHQDIKFFFTYEVQISIFINQRFDFNFDSGKIILIWHAFDHWITLTNIRFQNEASSTDCSNSIFVYDSLNNKYYLESLKPLFRIMYPNKRLIKVTTVKVASQSGSNDCGLFALAYAHSLSNNEDPALIKYDQAKMRENFNNFILKRNNDYKIDKINTNRLEREESIFNLEI